LGKLEAHLARVMNASTDASASKKSTDASSRNDVSESSAATTGRTAGSNERTFVRVGTDRLDALMNLAGELVVSRSRLLSRVDTLRLMQTELGRGSRRLIDTVDRFREEHEFSRLDGRTEQRTFALAAGAEHSMPTTTQAAEASAASDARADG